MKVTFRFEPIGFYILIKTDIQLEIVTNLHIMQYVMCSLFEGQME